MASTPGAATNAQQQLLILASAGATQMTPMNAPALATYTRPRLRLIMPDDTDRTTPTDIAPPPSVDDGPITQPPGKLETMLPGRPPLSLEDSYLDRAIRVVAEAGEDMRKGREEAREQHNAVLAEIRRSDANQTRNYEMVRDEIRRLKESDVNQDAKLAAVTKELANLTGRIDVIERAGVTPALQTDLRDVKDSVAMLIEAVATMSAAGNTSKTPLTGSRVLLVDDHDLIRKSLSRVLGSLGASVITAATLDAVKASMGFDPDCALVDVQLAGGEDGIAIAEWLLGSARLPAARVVLLTGNDGPGPAITAGRLGVTLLGKPPRQDDLVRVIREASASRAS